jgi:lipopolysaccharide export system protein LptA
MKYILILLIGFNIIFAKTVDVDIQAQFFDSDDSKDTVIFRGSVSMIKSDDTLVCDELTLKTKLNKLTNKKDIVSYTAIGNVSFTIRNETQDIIGNGDKVIFNGKNELYEIIGNGYLEDKINKKIIKGDKIYLNQKTGHTRIKGTKEKPVQFKFTVELNKNSKKKD